MRQHANAGTLTSCIVNGGRANITGAAVLLAWASEHNMMITELSQAQLEHYLTQRPGCRWTATSFVIWLGESRINRTISLAAVPKAHPWSATASNRGASRSAGLFSLAGQIPAPVLADLIGIGRNTATRWAALAAHDWSSYTRQRAQQLQSRTGSPDTR